MSLTNLAILNAKPKERQYKLYDAQGLYLIVTLRANIPGLAAELKWKVKRFRVAFQTLVDNGMIVFDERVGLISCSPN